VKTTNPSHLILRLMFLPVAIVEESLKLLSRSIPMISLPTRACAGHYSKKETFDEDYLRVSEGYLGMPYAPTTAPRAGLDRAKRASRREPVPPVRDQAAPRLLFAVALGVFVVAPLLWSALMAVCSGGVDLGGYAESVGDYIGPDERAHLAAGHAIGGVN
jgi:hypothetical protein